MEKFLRVSFSLFILFVLGACNNSAAIKYDETVELGIKYIADENLTKAAEQFHLALQKNQKITFPKQSLSKSHFIKVH